MEAVCSESSRCNIKKFLTKWCSSIILKTSNQEEIAAFRKLEKEKNRLIRINGHISFNETCLINKLLPTYTNIYIQKVGIDTSSRIM